MSNRLALLVITDGRRDCLSQTLSALDLVVDGTRIGQRVVVDDATESPDFVDWVDQLGFDVHVRPTAQRRGFAGAIQAGWDTLDDSDYVLHLEDDFIINRFWDVRNVMRFLDAHQGIAQVALRRQPWSPPEIVTNTVAEMWPDEYVEHHAPEMFWDWLEHDLFFTTNPSIYRGPITQRGWPQQEHSGKVFGERLKADGFRFAFWGMRADQPWCHHIGVQRVGIGY